MPKKAQETTQDYKSNIENYIDEFRSYDTFAEAVRHLPGMYIGATGNVGWKACIREIFQNAIDEMIKKESPCNHVVFVFDEKTQSATVIDNGRGIPLGHIVQIYTSAHMSTNFEETKKPFEYSSGTHGVGGGVAMALSKKFIVQSTVLGECHKVEFDSGIPWKKGEVKVKADPEMSQGTMVYLEPDIDIIGETNLSVEEIYQTLVLKIFPLIPRGYTIDFTGLKYDGSSFVQHLVNTEGIKWDLQRKIQKPLITPIEFGDDTGIMKFHAVFTYDPSDMNDREDIDAYANYTPCVGVNVDGFLSGLCSFFMGYVNKIYLKNAKITINSNDVKTGLKAVVDAAHLTPTFTGQGKTAINNPDLEKFIIDLTKKSLDGWSKTNPTELNKLCKYFKDIAEIRIKLENGKTKLSNQYAKSVISGDPDKYLKPTGKDNLELYIVEGDSAYGSARSARNHETDGIYPIRGKIINAFTATKANFFKNSETAAICKLITGQDRYDPNFDAKKSRFKKIIFMTDADPDGNHIRTLLLRMFLMYYPSFLENGMVYAACPPLFGIKQNGKIRYFATNVELGKYTQSLFSKKYTLEDTKTKKQLSQSEMSKLFGLNVDYTKTLETASYICGVDVRVLEDVLIQIADEIDFTVRNTSSYAFAQARFSMSSINQNTLSGMIDSQVSYSLKNLDIQKMKKRIESKYRFMNVSIVNGTLLISGLAFEKNQNIPINATFIRNCYEAIRLIAKNERRYFRVNGQVMSLYEVMNLIDKLLPNLMRFKGLGEQNPSELRESTMSIQNRTLIQYTLESAKDEIEMIRIIDSDKSALLRGIHITRQDLE